MESPSNRSSTLVSVSIVQHYGDCHHHHYFRRIQLSPLQRPNHSLISLAGCLAPTLPIAASAFAFALPLRASYSIERFFSRTRQFVYSGSLRLAREIESLFLRLRYHTWRDGAITIRVSFNCGRWSWSVEWGTLLRGLQSRAQLTEIGFYRRRYHHCRQ
jgi:hypothetical protein